MTEKRSLSSRFYRWTAKPRNARIAATLMVLGWTVVAAAGSETLTDDTAVHVGFVATVIGGALAFMACFAGISKWVAEPAARKVLHEHLARGAQSHAELLPRAEYDVRHEQLMKEIGEIKILVAKVARDRGR